MALSNQEAQRLRHEFIGDEHILLGLAKSGTGVGFEILKKMNVGLPNIISKVEKIVINGSKMTQTGRKPLTSQSKKAIEYATEEATNLKHLYVGTEHLLLGLLRVDGFASQVLMDFGLNYDNVLIKVLLAHSVSVSAKPVHDTTQMPELRAKEDTALKNADYECSKSPYISQMNSHEKTVIELVESIAIGDIKPKTEEELTQPVLEALSKVESGLFEVLNTLTNPKLILKCDATEATKSIIDTAKFIEDFIKFRDKLLS